MSHRPTLHRNSSASESNPSSKPSALTKHLKPTTTSSDPTQPSKPSSIVKHFSTLNLNHKPRPRVQSQTKHPPLVDTHLQAKAMTSSAIFDSSKYSLPKPTIEKQRSYRTSKEKPRSKVQRLLKNEKKDCDRRSMVVEDVKIEKSRNISVVEEHDDVTDVIKRSSVSMVPGGGGRRRSFCGSQVHLGDVFAINGAKMISVDMPPFMQIHAVDCARKAIDSMEKFTSKTLAFSLKKEFDGVYGPAWHCIVGTGFGSFVTHSVGGFLYFSMDRKLYILLFKTAVQKAD